MRVHVDEARRHELATRVDFLAAASGNLADCDDRVALDGDIALARGRAGPIGDRAAANDEVVSQIGHDVSSSDRRVMRAFL